MTFHSILFARREDSRQNETREAPDFFVDVHLDQIVDVITANKQEYSLKPFFYMPLRDIDSIAYRHEVLRDLEQEKLFEHLQAFAQNMRAMREHLAQAGKLHYTYQRERWFLDAVEIYCDAVLDLARDLSLVAVQSRGFVAFRDSLADYASSGSFTSLLADTKQLQADLSAVYYSLILKGNSVKVRKYEGERDYSADVEETFEKFKQGVVKDYRVKFRNWPEMDHVEARILDLVARLYPDLFARLDAFFAHHNGKYLDATIGTFDREVQFYVAYREYVARFQRAGLTFCYPQVSPTCKEVAVSDGFDASLASQRITEHLPIVCHDFSLKGKERILVVTGPNQGGKTTFARAFGQAHYLACLGCLVPGREARLFLCDRLFTHFEKEENIQDLRSKLEDDLVRIHSMLAQATPNSIIILNEILTSTTVSDALFLSKETLEKILQLDALGVWVTFIDELASFSEKTVSMVSAVAPDNPAVRTYQILRKPADGLAHAVAVAEKYRLTYHSLKERLHS